MGLFTLMREELEPLVSGDKPRQNKKIAIIIPFIIVFISILNLKGGLSRYISLKYIDSYTIVGIVTNMFLENGFLSHIVNPIFLYIIINQLSRSWSIRTIIVFGYAVSSICNAITWLVFLVVAHFDSHLVFSVSGSLSIVVALTCGIIYSSSNKEKINLFGKLMLTPANILLSVVIWSIASIRWPPVSLVSAITAYAISMVFIRYFREQLLIPTNELFNWSDFIPFAKEDKPQSILDSLGLTASSQELSEAEQQRRLRALRAIEERLEALQAKH